MSKNQEIINEQVVVLSQNAVIDYSGIDRIIKSVKSRIEQLNIDEIEATEENKSVLKELRSELNRELADYENARKEIKKKVDEPYKEFEQAYKPLKELYDDASNTLREKVNTIEDTQREEKRNNLELYFNELKVLANKELEEKVKLNLNFLCFNHLDLSITLSASETSLKKQIKEALEIVKNDLLVISGSQNKARLYAKYSTNLSLSKSMFELQEELKRESEIIETTTTEPQVELAKEEVNVEENVVEEIIELFFLIEDTKTNIQKARQFLIDNDINYKIVKKK